MGTLGAAQDYDGFVRSTKGDWDTNPFHKLNHKELEVLYIHMNILVSRGLASSDPGCIPVGDVVDDSTVWWLSAARNDNSEVIWTRGLGLEGQVEWYQRLLDYGVEVFMGELHPVQVSLVTDVVCDEVERRVLAADQRGLDPSDPLQLHECRVLDEWLSLGDKLKSIAVPLRY